MKLAALLFTFLLFTLPVFGQARTSERIVSIPFSQLDPTGNLPNGSEFYIINGLPGSTPCTAGGRGTTAYKIDGVWQCPRLTPGVGSGDVLGPPSATAGQFAVFSNSNGKNITGLALTGVLNVNNGVPSALSTSGSGNVVLTSGATLATPTLTTPIIASFTNATHSHENAAGGGQLNASNVFSSGTIPIARIVSGTITNSKCLRVNNVGQIAVAADDCGTGGGGSAGGVSGNLTFNESGSFGGIANSSYDALTGRLTFNQKANSNDTIYSQRFTDTSPTGSFLRFRNATGATDLFVVAASGAVTLSSTLTVKTTAAPATPAAGNTVLWTDSTDKNLKAQDDAGNVSGTVRPVTCSGTDKISSISSAGVVTCTADQGGTGTGVITLNTLNTSDQTFVPVDDANIDLSIVSSVSTHTFTVAWVGALSKARQHAATAYTDAGNTFSTGAQSFAAATSLTVPTAAGASPTASAQIAYDSTSSTLEAGINGTNRTVAFTQGSQTFSDKTLDNSNTLNLRDTLLTLQDNTDSTKTANFELSGITTGTNRVVSIANAASTTVQPSTLTTSQWVTHIDSAGVQQKAQPTLADFSGTVPAVRGGTDQTAVAQGDLLFGSATNTWSRLAKSTSATRYLANTGASNNPQWDQVNLANGVTGTLADGNLSANVTLLGSSIDLSGAEATGILAAARFPALTGDVTTSSGSLTTTIANDAVTNAKMANMATATFKGRTTAGTGDPEDLTATQATALLNNATTTVKGLVPAPGSATGAFLRDDMTWAAPSGTGDMVLASPQTNTGAKTFNDGSLILNGGDYGVSDGSMPTGVEKSFFLNTNASSRHLFFYNNGSYRQIFQAGIDAINLASANVAGITPLANGGTNQSSWTASRCVQVNSAGTALEAASAACGSGGGGSGTVSSATTNQVAYYTGSTTVSGDAGMTYNSSTDALTVASLITNGTGAGSVELEEGTAPSAVANRVTVTAPTDVTAGGWVLSLPTTAGTNGQFLQTNGSGVTTWATPSGSGTVTATGGSLTSNAVVLGAGSTDTKIVAGIITDGTSKLTLGVAGTSVGSIDFKNATSGTVTLSPVTGALGTVTLSLPARTATVATTTGTLTNGRCVEIDASGNFVQSAAACGSGGSGTVTVVSSGSLTSTAIVTGGGTTTLQTPSATSTLDSSGNMSLPGSLAISGSGAGYTELAEGTAPSAVANRVTVAAPTDVTAGGWVLSLPTTAGTNGQFLQTNGSGVTTWATPSGSGTVTATGGSLTANAIVLGAGSTDTKVVAGIVTDGTSKLTLGVGGTSVGSIDFKNATSGTITLAPVTGALGTVTLSLPARTDTLVTLGGTETLTAKTLTTPTIASFTNATHNHTDAAGGGQLTDAALSAAVGTAKGGTGFTDTTFSGNTHKLVTTTGTLTSGRCAEWDASGNLIQAAAACGSGGSGTISSGATNAIPKYTASTTIDDSLLSDDGTTLSYSGTGGLSLTASGGGFIQLTEGTPPSIVANTVQHAVAPDAPAAGVQYLWGSTAAASGILRVANSSGVMTVTQDAGISNLASSTSADLAGVLSDEQGSGGGFVRATSPTLTTPVLGVATATSINGNTFTTGTYTLTGGAGKTLTFNNSITFAGTDSTTMTFPATSGTVVTADSTVTKTNFTLDVEGTGNVITTLSVIDFPAAGCNNATASSFWDLPASSPAVATCVTGTNTQKAYLDFADTSGGFSAQTGFRLPADLTGTIDAKITWLSAATSGNVKWSLSTICVATDATETDDPAFNTASTSTTAVPGVASRLQTSSITSLTITGCAAGEFMHVKIFRDGNDAADTAGATVRLAGVQFILRRAQ